jgi:hypothetical protein
MQLITHQLYKRSLQLVATALIYTSKSFQVIFRELPMPRASWSGFLRLSLGYEYDRGQFVTFSAEELRALDVESSKVIDLERFVPRGDIDPVYVDTAYYLYPDGPIAVEALRVIGVAMAEAGVAGIGRLTLSRRERMVMVEPRGTGMALFTLRRRRGSDGAIPQPRGRSRCRDGGNRRRDHHTAHREV